MNSLSPTSQSGYGDFDYTIDCNKATPGCGPGASDPDLGPLQFDVTLTGAGTLTPSDFIVSGDWFFASDIKAGNGKTGNVTSSSETDPTPAPEPGSVLLLITVLCFTLFPLKKRLIS